MRMVRDTFLHFLADNLSTVTIHPLRRDPNYPDDAKLVENALNVSFINQTLDPVVCTETVVLDFVVAKELSNEDMVKTVYSLLNATYYCPLLDYTVPASPTGTHSYIYWKRPIRFRPIHNEFYYHQSCHLDLHFHIPEYDLI